MKRTASKRGRNAAILERVVEEIASQKAEEMYRAYLSSPAGRAFRRLEALLDSIERRLRGDGRRSPTLQLVELKRLADRLLACQRAMHRARRAPVRLQES